MRRVALLVVLLLGMMSAGLTPGASTDAAAQDANARGWLELSSANPAPGCWVDTSVTMTRDGAPLSDVEIGISFILDSQVVYGTRSVTDGNGVASLGFDTGWAPDGSQGWLDVQVNGVSSGGMQVNVGDGGSCNGDDTGTDIWATVSDGDYPSHSAENDWTSGGGPVVSVPVANYGQRRGLSCEYASLVSAMSAYGVSVSEYDFDGLVGWSDNPHWGYRGNIEGTWGGTDDYGVYAEPLAQVLPDFGFTGDVFYAGGDTSQLTSRLDAGEPVLVWLALLGDTSFTAYADDGTPYQLTPGQHTVVAYGYDDNGVYVMDPALGAKRFYDWGWFLSMWNVFDGMSMGVVPAS